MLKSKGPALIIMANPPPSSPQGPSGAYYAAPQAYGGLQVQPNSYPPLQSYAVLQPQSDSPAQGAPLLSPPFAIYAGQPIGQPGGQFRIQNSKVLAYIYMILAVVIILLSAVDLELHYWVYICGGNISLTHIYWFDSPLSLSEAKDIYCSISIYEDFCGNMCNIIKELLTSGKVMRGMGIAGAVCTGACFLIILLLVIRRTTNRRIRQIVRLAVVLTAVMWLVGTLVYFGYALNVGNGDGGSVIGQGLILALVIMVLQLVNCALGNAAITKLTCE